MSVRVVLVDDEALARGGLRLILGSEDGIEVVGEAADGAEALEVVAATEPDVVLLDLRMPVLDGLGTLRALTAAGDAARVVVLTTFDTDENVRTALAEGASGFLLKDAPADQLVAAIRAAAAGDAVLSPVVARRIAHELASVRRPAVPETIDALTPREREVLLLLAEGASNAEIAAALYIGEGTVKTHVARVLDKIGVRDRLQAVVVAYRAGLAR
ncbi:response regulator transcription factor [Knoellia locipacati]|uniref:response regulator n=1 Tax=Knoellia locipacati TaxID=882824 RepID=UPI00384F14AB